MKPGISSYTYTWAVGVPGFLPEKCLSATDLINIAFDKGLEVVQIADNLPLEELPVNELDKLRHHAQARGIRIEMGCRGLIPEHAMKCLETAKRVDSAILRMVIDSKDFQPPLESINSIIRELLPEFESRKIKLAIENHDRFKAREFESIVLSAASEYVGICLDSVNSMGAGEGFETVSEILLPYTINLHVKDFTIRRVSHKMGIIIEGMPAGKGILDISSLISGLEKKGLCETAILELWTPPMEKLNDTIHKESQWADESIEYLKSVFNKNTI